MHSEGVSGVYSRFGQQYAENQNLSDTVQSW